MNVQEVLLITINESNIHLEPPFICLRLPKIKQAIISDYKIHQMNMLLFYKQK